jgi:hypothetical protein
VAATELKSTADAEKKTVATAIKNVRFIALTPCEG